MGGSKRFMEQRQEGLAWARTFLVKIGTLRSCDIHGDVFNGDGDLKRAYAILNARVTSGETTLDEGRTRPEAAALLKDAYHESNGPDSCQSCDHYMRK